MAISGVTAAVIISSTTPLVAKIVPNTAANPAWLVW